MGLGDGQRRFGFAPEGEQELDRGGADVLHMRVDSPMGDDFGVGGGDFEEDLHGLLDRGGGGNGDGHFEAGGIALQAVVHDRALEDDAIRDEDFHAVVAVELATTGADRSDGAGEGAHFDQIADADGAFEEKDEATDEVVDELLGAETNGDGGRATQEGENSQGNLNGGEGDETDEEEKRVVGEFLDNRTSCWIEIKPLADARAEPAAKGGGKKSPDEQDRQGGQEHAESHRACALDELAIHINRIAKREERSFPNLDHAIAEDIHGEIENCGARRGGSGFSGLQRRYQPGQADGREEFSKMEWYCHGKKSR